METIRFNWRKDSTPKISVIIPCYNCEVYVAETLDSIDSQTFCDLEIICVNDGSTDGTEEVLKEKLASLSVPSSIVNQANAGVSMARNVGIRESRGQYLLFCDADDMFHPRMAELLLYAIEKNSADTAYCLLSREKTCLTEDASGKENKLNTRYDAMRDLFFKMDRIGFYCYLYKKDILADTGILFDINTKHFEDREFNWKYLANCRNAAYVDDRLYWYRRTENSVTNVAKPAWRTDGMEAAMRIADYLKKKNCEGAEEMGRKLVARVFWSSAKLFTVSSQKKLFLRLTKTFDGKTYMKENRRDSNRLVALSAGLYLIHPLLFYYVVRMKKGHR